MDMRTQCADGCSDDGPVRSLYYRLLESWNRRDAAAFASLFAEDGVVIGFDGSQHTGRSAIQTDLSQIFKAHRTPAYVGKLRQIRFPIPGVAIALAVAGMTPDGQSDINPTLNAVQSLVAQNNGKGWLIALFQNTPAQFHGRPELSAALTDELRALLAESADNWPDN